MKKNLQKLPAFDVYIYTYKPSSVRQLAVYCGLFVGAGFLYRALHFAVAMCAYQDAHGVVRWSDEICFAFANACRFSGLAVNLSAENETSALPCRRQPR